MERARSCLGTKRVAGGCRPCALVFDASQHIGSIDPSLVFDYDGSLWLLWKSDGNCCGRPTVIYSQRLTPDGLAVAGDPVELIRNDLWWERDVVEGPTMAYGSSGYHLLYSANRWDTDKYTVGHATCESVVGPCVKDPDPWLASYNGAWGPGGPEFVTNADGWTGLLVYHAWTAPGVGYPDGARGLFVAELQLVAGVPVSPSFGGSGALGRPRPAATLPEPTTASAVRRAPFV